MVDNGESHTEPPSSEHLTMNTTRRTALLASWGWCLSGRQAWAQSPPTVAAAADLKWALPPLVARFEQESGLTLRVVFGASGSLCAQILQGAPFQLFLSADEAYVQRLADSGLTRQGSLGQVYALGRIGLLVPRRGALRADGSLRDLGQALRDGRLQRLALANPLHAPYGQRAREALAHAGLWDRLQPHLVLGENVAQAAQFALSGAAQGGLVAQAVARAPEVSERGHFALIDSHWHRPLAQRMVLLHSAQAPMLAFYDFLRSPAVRDHWARHGLSNEQD